MVCRGRSRIWRLVVSISSPLLNKHPDQANDVLARERDTRFHSPIVFLQRKAKEEEDRKREEERRKAREAAEREVCASNQHTVIWSCFIVYSAMCSPFDSEVR